MKSERGFEAYGEFKDDRNQDIRLQESSEAGRPHAWLFCEGTTFEHPTPYMSVKQAKKLVAMLQKFIKHVNSPKNWRNDPEYKKNWG